MNKSGMFTFSEAIRYLKEGKKVARKGWNGKGMYLFLVDGEKLASSLSVGNLRCTTSVCMKTAQNTITVGWNASQADMLADDWTISEKKCSNE